MSLQIYTYESKDEGLKGHGFVQVNGESVSAHFSFGGKGATKEEATRHARLFVDAMQDSGEVVTKMKALADDLAALIAKAEGRA